VLALGGPKRVSITLLRNLSTRELVDAVRDGIRPNSSPEEQRAVKGRIDGLMADLLAVPQGRKATSSRSTGCRMLAPSWL
jgi:hypothetical protein